MTNKERDEKLALYYFEITDIWKRFCEQHMHLFDVTCDEYTCLLNSELEELEIKLQQKNDIIQNIHTLEEIRKDIITRMSVDFPTNNIKGVSTLLDFMTKYDVEKKEKHLFRFNALLIDLIEKIQDQNKRNQLFINKALHSLKQIRMETLGKKNYSIYSAKGAAVEKVT